MECSACTVACILILHVLTFLVMAWAKRLLSTSTCRFWKSRSWGFSSCEYIWGLEGISGQKIKYSSLGLRSSGSRFGDVRLLRYEIVSFYYIFASLQRYSTWWNARRTDALHANKASMKLQGMELPAPGQKPADRFPTNCRVTTHPKQLQAQNNPNT